MKVVHCKKAKFDVYVGRPSKWGNPFVIGKDGDRAAVIRKYEAWVKSKPELMAALPELSGKVLACWCAPQACHADVLVRLANQPEQNEGSCTYCGNCDGPLFDGYCGRA